MTNQHPRLPAPAEWILVIVTFTACFFVALFAATPRKSDLTTGQPETLAPDCTASPEPRRLLELRLRLAHAQARLELVNEEFVDLLGPPQRAPRDLEPRFAEAGLGAVLDELRPDHPIWVDCSLYPCAIVVHSAADDRGLTSLDELKDWLSDRGYPHLVTTGSTLNVHPGPSIASWSVAVLPGPPDSQQERWARSVAARAEMRTRVELAQR